MIQTEPDYGEPQFKVSRERIGDWSVTIQITTRDDWEWAAQKNDGDVSCSLTSLGKGLRGLKSYDAAKAHCMSVLESLTPNGFIPQSYVSTEDASREIHRLENGRWICLRDGALVLGEYDFATASLAAAAHRVENYT